MFTTELIQNSLVLCPFGLIFIVALNANMALQKIGT
jgi:hypothetical protein